MRYLELNPEEGQRAHWRRYVCRPSGGCAWGSILLRLRLSTLQCSGQG